MLSAKVNDRCEIIEKSMRKFGYEPSSLIEILHIAQERFGYLDINTLKFIATKLNTPFSKVYGVVTFYNYFHLKPKGKHTVVVCTGTACYIKGANKILENMQTKWSIKVGETTKDGNLSLLTARCVGSCSIAPVVIYDGKTKGNVTLDESIKELQRVLL